MGKASESKTAPKGWYSRRHPTNAEETAARLDYLKKHPHKRLHKGRK